MDNTWGNTVQYNEIHWHWPIAVYLFLAGLSAGALIISVLLRRRSNSADEGCSCFVRAGAIIAPIAIVVGLGLLILDLTNPLNFWQLLIHWNFTSVMSIGVALLVVYTPVSILFALSVFRDSIKADWLRRIAVAVDSTWLHLVAVVLAIGVGAYTGFLLSAMVATPLYNTAVLPLLFLVSGVSAGIAATVLVGLVMARKRIFLDQLDYSSHVDAYMIAFELAILFLMFVGLFFAGGAHAAAGSAALTAGPWSWVFWVGVIGIGIVVPMTLHLFGAKEKQLNEHSSIARVFSRFINRYPKPEGAGSRSLPVLTMLSAVLVITGSLLLRLFVVYAGQLTI